MIEIWVIIWFCTTPQNPECMGLHERPWGLGSSPFRYHSEQRCVEGAEKVAESYWNEKRFKLEYACRRQSDWEPFVPRRRYP